jgi:antirestriction protein
VTVTPRIYVASLADYNAGTLHGVWVNADRPAQEIEAFVAIMLGESHGHIAEEWAIHDYEGFGSLRLSEWESFERVSAIASGIAEHGLAFAAWMSYDESRDPSDTQAFEDAYRGEWESLRAYAEDFADSTGLNDLAEKAGSRYVTVDIAMLERDLDIEMYTVEADDYTVYLFDPQ